MENTQVECLSYESSNDIESQKVETQELIGYGMSSEVYLVQHLKQEAFVIKKFKKDYPLEDIEQEGSLHKKLNSRHIIQIQEINPKQFILEYAEHGDLFEYVRRSRFSEKLARTFFIQLIEGLKDMHSLGIAHRDIKLDNLLVGKDYQIKIADFGWATQYKGNQLLSERAGTDEQLPPEIIEYKMYSPEKLDVFLCGVVLFTMVCGISPINFRAKKTDKIYKYFANQMPHQLWKAFREKKGITVSEEFKNIIEQLLSYDFKSRPTLQEISEHLWIKKGQIYDENSSDELRNEMEKIRKLGCIGEMKGQDQQPEPVVEEELKQM